MLHRLVELFRYSAVSIGIRVAGMRRVMTLYPALPLSIIFCIYESQLPPNVHNAWVILIQVAGLRWIVLWQGIECVPGHADIYNTTTCTQNDFGIMKNNGW